MVGELLKQAGLEGYFTNHSLRRTCATRLFQAGQDVKIPKEIMGYISDSVYKYQTTSDAQKMHASSIIQGEVKPIKLSEASPMEIVESPKSVPLEEKCKLERLTLPISKTEYKENCENEDKIIEKNVSDVIQSAVSAVGKHRAKLSIEVK